MSETNQNERMVSLNINFWRVRDSDKSGSFDMSCDGPESWTFADTGSHYGMQVDERTDEAKLKEFGLKMSALVREYFGAMPPVL